MSLRRRALAVALVATCAACRGVAPPIGHRRDVPPQRGGTLEMANFLDVRALDPAIAFDGSSTPLLQLMFAPLVDYDRQGRIAPLLAERFSVSDDGRRVSFELRQGARFHDGEEVTAADVKRSFERALDHATPCPAPSFYTSIVGYGAFHDGTKDERGKLVFAPHLEGVVVDGRYALHVDLVAPDATFLPALTLYFVAPVCKSAGSTYTPDWGTRPCGAGPFRLEHWQPSREVSVVRHEGYFDPALPYLDRIRWLQLVPASTQRFKFEDGDLDHLRQLSAVDLVSYLKDPRWKPYGQWEPAKETSGIFFNTQMKPFDNVELRRAFAAAIDWREVTSVRPELGVATQVLPPSVEGHDPSFVGQRHDLAAALAHMKNAGYPFDPATKTGGLPEPVRFVGPAESSVTEAIAPMVQQAALRIGIRMEIVQVSYPAYLALASRRGQVQLGYRGWTMDYPDASDFFEPILSTESIQDEESQNYSFYSNPELDLLLKKAHVELDPAARRAMYRRCEEIVRDDAPWALGYTTRWYELVQPYVHGYAPDTKHMEDVRFAWIDADERRHALARTHARDPLALIRPWGRR